MSTETERPERCPTCGSTDQGTRLWMYHPTEDDVCWDDWHSPVSEVKPPAPIARHATETALDFDGEIEFLKDCENKTGIFAAQPPTAAGSPTPQALRAPTGMLRYMDMMKAACNCRSVEECTHKFDNIPQEEINRIVRDSVKRENKALRERAEKLESDLAEARRALREIADSEQGSTAPPHTTSIFLRHWRHQHGIASADMKLKDWQSFAADYADQQPASLRADNESLRHEVEKNTGLREEIERLRRREQESFTAFAQLASFLGNPTLEADSDSSLELELVKLAIGRTKKAHSDLAEAKQEIERLQKGGAN